ncbi:MAG: LysE family translocator [Janthinobacterium lividum]
MWSLNEHWTVLARGAGLGLAVAAPVGPTCLLCVQRTLSAGVGAGLATGYGAATTHMIYGTVAVTGSVMALAAAAHWSAALKTCCGVFLLYLAVRSIRRAPGIAPPRACQVRAYLTGLSWTLGNPMTVLTFAALAPGVLSENHDALRDVPLLALGVAAGSATWWTLVVCAVAWTRHRLDPRILGAANLVTGMALAAFAAVMLASAAGM